jgi:hypothetical protein
MSRLTAWIHSWKTRNAWRRGGLSLPLMRECFPVVCCWSAKAGCTTVLKWFLQHNGLLEQAMQHGAWLHDFRVQRLEEPGYERRCRRAVRSDAFHVIKVIRDPAKRAVSAYLHYLRYASPQWIGTNALTEWKAANGLGGQQGVSFEQFLEFALDLQRSGQSPDPHVRPQYNGVWDPHVDAYIPLENIEAVLEETERLCGLPHVDVRSLSESQHHNRPTCQHQWPHNASRIAATSETIDQLGVPPAELLLDETTIPILQAAYRADYEAYARFYPARSEVAR